MASEFYLTVYADEFINISFYTNLRYMYFCIYVKFRAYTETVVRFSNVRAYFFIKKTYSGDR